MTEAAFKAILVGDTGVGKSALCFRFVDGTFFEDHTATLGVDFKYTTIPTKDVFPSASTNSSKSANGEENQEVIKMQLWDTAGQEQFHAMTSQYYRGSHGVVLCFDLTSRHSFERLDWWVARLAKYLGTGLPSEREPTAAVTPTSTPTTAALPPTEEACVGRAGSSSTPSGTPTTPAADDDGAKKKPTHLPSDANTTSLGLPPVLLVGCKLDLCGEDGPPDSVGSSGGGAKGGVRCSASPARLSAREISVSEAAAYAEMRGLHYMETSSKTAAKVADAFVFLTREMIRHSGTNGAPKPALTAGQKAAAARLGRAPAPGAVDESGKAKSNCCFS